MRGEPTSRIRFSLDREKAVEAVVYLANRLPGIGFFHLAKVLYFAEKRHLNDYGRPILGDAYVAMEHGPVPSFVYDLLKTNPFLPHEMLREVGESLKVEASPRPAVQATRQADTGRFSRTDLACLNWALQEYGRLPFGRLWELGHREEAWQEARRNGQMDYVLMIDPENRKRLAEELLELGPDLAL